MRSEPTNVKSQKWSLYGRFLAVMVPTRAMDTPPESNKQEYKSYRDILKDKEPDSDITFLGYFLYAPPFVLTLVIALGGSLLALTGWFGDIRRLVMYGCCILPLLTLVPLVMIGSYYQVVDYRKFSSEQRIAKAAIARGEPDDVPVTLYYEQHNKPTNFKTILVGALAALPGVLIGIGITLDDLGII